MSLPLEHRWLLSPRAGLSWGSWPAIEPTSRKQSELLPNQVQQAFQTWLSALNLDQNESAPSIAITEIPDRVLPILIPNRVWELAQDPNQLQIRVLGRDIKDCHQSLRLFVTEKVTKAPVSDPKEWEQWVKQHQDYVAHNGITKVIPAPGPGIDRLQAANYHYFVTGLLTLQDRIWLRLNLKSDQSLPGVLHVGSFDGQIGVGLAKEFYQLTLPGIARALGFKFITGQNDINNVGFFTAVAGRVTLGDIRTQYRKQFFRTFDEEVLDTNTVQFLDPSDKAKFCW